jgi:hypothetical protein
VQGQTYKYRRYLGSIGLWWETASYGWVGRLSDGKVWFLREKLQLEVEEMGENPTREITEKLRTKSASMPPVRVTKAPSAPKRDEDAVTGWEQYSALPVHTHWEARIHTERNINLRGCTWGSELCQSCMECISNVEENDVLPHPELNVWGDEEEKERGNAALPWEG